MNGFTWMLLLPLLPVAIRGLLVIRFWRLMEGEVPEEEQDAAEHRVVILALGGSSFTASLAIPAYGISAGADVHLTIYFVVLSFFSYLASLNLQGHKYTRLREHIASGLFDVGTWCLILAVLDMVWLASGPTVVYLTLLAVGFAVWGSDVLRRFRAQNSFLSRSEIHERKEGQRAD